MGGTRDRNISSTLPYFIFLVAIRFFVAKYIIDNAVWRSQLSRQSHVLEIVGAEPTTAIFNYFSNNNDTNTLHNVGQKTLHFNMGG